MIDERFSKQSFQAAGWNTDRAAQLSEQLGEEVQRRLMAGIRSEFGKIIQTLNAMGHDLQPVANQNDDGIHHRDFSESGDERKYAMILALDLVITAGYPYSRPFLTNVDDKDEPV